MAAARLQLMCMLFFDLEMPHEHAVEFLQLASVSDSFFPASPEDVGYGGRDPDRRAPELNSPPAHACCEGNWGGCGVAACGSGGGAAASASADSCQLQVELVGGRRASARAVHQQPMSFHLAVPLTFVTSQGTRFAYDGLVPRLGTMQRSMAMVRDDIAASECREHVLVVASDNRMWQRAAAAPRGCASRFCAASRIECVLVRHIMRRAHEVHVSNL